MTYRRYVQSFVLVLVAFLLVNYLVWHCCTEKILTASHGEGGDLARLGYLPSFKLERRNQDDLPRRHRSLRDGSGGPVDVVTLGDSFSNGGGGGRNRYYQDHLASIQGLTVLNVPPYQEPSHPTLDPMQTLVLLMNSGELYRMAPRAVLLGVSVKQTVEFLGHPLDLSQQVPVEKLRDPKNYHWYDSFPPPSGPLNFISAGNLSYLYYQVVGPLAHRTAKAVELGTLDRPLFSVQGRSLLYLKDDVHKISSNTPENLGRINDNLNRLAELLAARGIRLYFMPCVDKYDLYSRYLVHNRRPLNGFFEGLRPLPRKYLLIDTKEILGRQLERGVQDLFYPDDTHWSWKASDAIFEKVSLR